MARQEPYGEQLRQARIRKGLDIHSVSRRLRIRIDILRAIEDGNFAALPPSGYVRNMVNAYARLVGLDPLALSELYLDELHLFETGRGRPREGAAREGRPARRGPAGSVRPADPTRPIDEPPSARSRAQGTARRRYDGRPGPARQAAPAAPYASASARGARGGERRSMGFSQSFLNAPAPTGRGAGTIGSYTPSTYTHRVGGQPQGSTLSGIGAMLLGRLPLILVAVAFIVLIVVVISLAFGGAHEESQDMPSVPISGLNDTSGQSQDAYTVSTAVAPTSAVMTVSIADGERSWVSVTVDGGTEEDVNEVLTGPVERSFSFTTSAKVEAGNVSAVTVKVDGKPVTLTEGDDGSYSYTARFSEILEAWQAEHGQRSSSSSAAASSSSSSSASSSASRSSGD